MRDTSQPVRHLRSYSGKLAFIVVAAVAAILLAIVTESLMFQYDVPVSPGAYVWGLLRTDSDCGFLGCIGSLMVTTIAIDSICWFVLLGLAAFIFARLGKSNDAGRMENPVRK